MMMGFGKQAGNEWKQPPISIDLWVEKDEPIAHGFEHGNTRKHNGIEWGRIYRVNLKWFIGNERGCNGPFTN